jgi:hypothetical protein
MPHIAAKKLDSKKQKKMRLLLFETGFFAAI